MSLQRSSSFKRSFSKIWSEGQGHQGSGAAASGSKAKQQPSAKSKAKAVGAERAYFKRETWDYMQVGRGKSDAQGCGCQKMPESPESEDSQATLIMGDVKAKASERVLTWEEEERKDRAEFLKMWEDADFRSQHFGSDIDSDENINSPDLAVIAGSCADGKAARAGAEDLDGEDSLEVVAFQDDTTESSAGIKAKVQKHEKKRRGCRSMHSPQASPA